MDINLIMIIIWAFLFLIALLVEIFTEALVSVWFCIGAVVAAALTYVPDMPWWGELIIFLGVSLLSFLIIRPLVNNKLQRIKTKTNVDTLIGKRGVVTKKISTLEKGEVKINDVIWNAIKRDSDDDIKEGDIIEVISIQGNKLLVEKAEKEEE